MPRKPSPLKNSQPKKYAFIVEAYTEEHYINRLKRLYRNTHQVGKVLNSRGGGAKNVLQEAKKFINKYQEKYLGYGVWFDKDAFFKEDCALKNQLDLQENVNIYISQPCVEHWLLAHFREINLSENKNCKFYIQILKKHIPDYKKNERLLFNKYIDKEKVEKALLRYPQLGDIPQRYFIGTYPHGLPRKLGG